MQQPDADQLGGDVHVADRHPGAADAAAHQVRRDPGRARTTTISSDEIARHRRAFGPVTDTPNSVALRHLDRAGGV